VFGLPYPFMGWPVLIAQVDIPPMIIPTNSVQTASLSSEAMGELSFPMREVTPSQNDQFSEVVYQGLMVISLLVNLFSVFPSLQRTIMRNIKHPFGYLLRQLLQLTSVLFIVFYLRGMRIDHFIRSDVFVFMCISTVLQLVMRFLPILMTYLNERYLHEKASFAACGTVFSFFCWFSPVIEELGKEYMYHTDAFAFLELFASFPLKKSTRVFPFIFHLGISGIEAPLVRIFLHIVWNCVVFFKYEKEMRYQAEQIELATTQWLTFPDQQNLKRLNMLWKEHTLYHYALLPFATIPGSFLSSYNSNFERLRALHYKKSIDGLKQVLLNFLIKMLSPTSMSLKDIERFAAFLVSFSVSRDKDQMLASITMYATSITDDLLVTKIKDVISKLISPLTPESNSFSDGWKKFSESADWILDGSSSFTNSEMFQWLRTIVTACLCVPVFNKMGLAFHAQRFSLYDEKVLRSSRNDGVNFVISVIRAMKSVCDVGVSYISGEGSLEKFQSNSPFSLFMKKADELYKMKSFICVGEQKEGFIEATQYRLHLDETIKTGRVLSASGAGLDPGSRSLIERKLTELECIEARLHAQDLASTKDPAFILLTVAPPGTGKSVITKASHKIMMETYGKAYDEKAVGVIDPEQDFQDHITNGTEIIHIEEVGIETPDSMKSSGASNTTKYLLLYGDTFPQVVNKSHLEDKGKTINLNKFVTGNTNSFDINAQLFTKFPGAVYRRITFQEVMVDPKFKKEGTNQPDPMKMEQYAQEKGIPVSYLIGYKIRFVTFDYTSPNFKVVNGAPTCRTDGPWLSFSQWTKELARLVYAHKQKCEAGHAAMSEIMKSTCPHGSWSNICSECIEASCDLTHESDTQRFLIVRTTFAQKVKSIFELLWRMFLYVSFVIVMWFLALFWRTGVPSAIYNFFATLCGTLVTQWIERTRYRLFDRMSTCWHYCFDQFYGRVSLEEINRRSKKTFQHITSSYNVLYRYSSALGTAEYILGGVVGWSILRGVIRWFSNKPPMSFEGNAQVRDPKPEFKTDYADITVKLKEQGIESRRMKPTSGDERNAWRENESASLVMEVNNGHPSDQIVRTIERQVYSATFTRDNVEVTFNVLAIAPEFVVTNAHNFERDGQFVGGVLRLTSSKLEGGDTRLCRSHTYNIDPAKYLLDLGDDVALVYVPSFQARDLVIYLSPTLQAIPFFFSHKSKGWLSTGLESKEVSIQLAAKFSWDRYILPQALLYDYPDHAVGLCGAPLIMSTGPATFLYGIHAAGAKGESRSLGVPLIKDRIMNGIARFRSSFKLTELTPEGCVKLFDIDGSDAIFGSPDSKSFLNWQAGFVDYEGTVKNLTYNKPNPKMTFLPTAEHAHKFGVETRNIDGEFKWGIPNFKEFHDESEDLGFYSPYHKWAAKSFQSSDYCDLEAVTAAMEEFWRNIEKANIGWDVRPLDPISVTAGDNKVYTIRSMNASTSMGFGFQGKKNDHMFQLITDQAPDGKTFNDEIWSHVLEDISTYVSGQTVRPISKASLKVEPRVRELKGGEFVTKQPRVFCATPATDVVIGRMFLLPILDLLKQDRQYCECMVGVNAMSKEWGKVRSFFEEKGVLDTSFGADISGFDTRMLVSVKHAAMTIIMRMAEKAGYSLVEQKVLRGYLTDTLYPLVLVKNDLLTMPNLIVSGRVGTAEFNSLCLSIIYRMVWHVLAREVGSTLSFNDNVQLITYGDDSKAGSKVPWFNQETFCKGCNYFGIVATTASKSQDFEQFVPFDDEEFLHRTWRWDEEYQVWCAPLAFDSMVRSLVLNTTSPIGPDAQAFEASHSINFELAQHGREVFEEKMERLHQILQDSGLITKCGEPRYKSFDEIMSMCYH